MSNSARPAWEKKQSKSKSKNAGTAPQRKEKVNEIKVEIVFKQWVIFQIDFSSSKELSGDPEDGPFLIFFFMVFFAFTCLVMYAISITDAILPVIIPNMTYADGDIWGCLDSGSVITGSVGS